MRRRLFWLPLFAALVTASLHAGTIEFQVIDLGSGMDRYVYTISGFILTQHQEIDLQFDASMYSNLTNPQASAGFSTAIEQPGNPLGAPGHFSLVATMDSPSFTGPFTIDFTFTGAGTPGSQPFAINQLDASDTNILSVISTGNTSPLSVPEPTTLSIGAAGLGWVSLRLARSRVRREAGPGGPART